MTPRSLVALAALALLATACGGDSKSPTEPGGNDDNSSYTASITGGYTKSLTGKSAFATNMAASDVGFALALGTEDGNNDAIIFWREQAGVLGTGTYDIMDYVANDQLPADKLGAMLVFEPVANSAVVCNLTGGTLTVSQSSANRLKGTINAQASCSDLTSAEEKTVTVTGSFDAIGGTVTIPNG